MEFDRHMDPCRVEACAPNAQTRIPFEWPLCKYKHYGGLYSVILSFSNRSHLVVQIMSLQVNIRISAPSQRLSYPNAEDQQSTRKTCTTSSRIRTQDILSSCHVSLHSVDAHLRKVIDWPQHSVALHKCTGGPLCLTTHDEDRRDDPGWEDWAGIRVAAVIHDEPC